jgi:3-isopropylmalate dehydratase small subunit
MDVINASGDLSSIDGSGKKNNLEKKRLSLGELRKKIKDAQKKLEVLIVNSKNKKSKNIKKEDIKILEYRFEINLLKRQMKKKKHEMVNNIIKGKRKYFDNGEYEVGKIQSHLKRKNKSQKSKQHFLNRSF